MIYDQLLYLMAEFGHLSIFTNLQKIYKKDMRLILRNGTLLYCFTTERYSRAMTKQVTRDSIVSLQTTSTRVTKPVTASPQSNIQWVYWYNSS